MDIILSKNLYLWMMFVIFNDVDASLRKTCKQRIDESDIVLGLTTKFIWKSVNNYEGDLTNFHDTLRNYFKFLHTVEKNANILSWCNKYDNTGCVDKLNESEIIIGWSTEIMWQISRQMSLEDLNKLTTEKLEKAKRLNNWDISELNRINNINDEIKKRKKLKNFYEKKKKKEKKKLEELDAELERKRLQEKEDLRQNNILVRKYLTFLHKSEVFDIKTMTTAHWCAQNEPLTCLEMIKKSDAISNSWTTLDAWEAAKKMSQSKIETLDSVTWRYVLAFRKFEYYNTYFEKNMDLVEKMYPYKWCLSIEKRCLESIRMAGFKIEHYSSEGFYNAKKYNKEHFANIKDNDYPKLGFVADFVNYLLEGKDKQADSTNYNKKDVYTWCMDHCVDNLNELKYNKNSKIITSLKDFVSLNKIIRKTSGCTRKYLDQQHLLLNFRDIIFKINSTKSKKWCEKECI